MVTREMLYPLAFYKRSAFNGSKGSVNYRIEKNTVDEQDCFLLTVWKGPYCYDVTTEDKKTFSFSFDEAGMEKLIVHLNQSEEEADEGAL